MAYCKFASYAKIQVQVKDQNRKIPTWTNGAKSRLTLTHLMNQKRQILKITFKISTSQQYLDEFFFLKVQVRVKIPIKAIWISISITCIFTEIMR